ncbi:TatD family hydrolase [Buchnera aphidicola (Periphyllus koelreuteriae)]|uniref:TatD family hydrolase n=1 Tax=Buchnera aphidicola TaxID=9 RepID=UPI0031B85949
MFLIDSHCHLDKLNFNKNKLSKILKKAYSNKVKIILSISISLNNFKKIKKLLKNNKYKIFYSCGIHPLHIKNKKNIFKKLYKYSKNEKVIAIGETGLDYFYSKNNILEQKYFFSKHIELSKKLNKPIIIHSRNSGKDIIKILKKNESHKLKGILHSFNDNLKIALQLLDMNFYISFSGMITFKNSKALQSIIKNIPLNRLLLETDSPYLTPEPYRGKENQPSYIYYIAKYISNLLKIDIEELSYITKKNFFKLFKLNKLKK